MLPAHVTTIQQKGHIAESYKSDHQAKSCFSLK